MCEAAVDCNYLPPMLADEEDVLQAVILFLDEHDAISLMLEATSDNLASMDSERRIFEGFASTIEATIAYPSASSSSSLSSSWSPLTAEPADTVPSPPQRPRVLVRSDKRKREQLANLREEVGELEKRLQELKKDQLRGPSPTYTGSSKPTSTNTDLHRYHVSAWQAVTMVQQRRREAAEHERDRLRELIMEQKIALRGIRRYMNRHASKTKLAISKLDPSLRRGIEGVKSTPIFV